MSSAGHPILSFAAAPRRSRRRCGGRRRRRARRRGVGGFSGRQTVPSLSAMLIVHITLAMQKTYRSVQCTCRCFFASTPNPQNRAQPRQLLHLPSSSKAESRWQELILFFGNLECLLRRCGKRWYGATSVAKFGNGKTVSIQQCPSVNAGKLNSLSKTPRTQISPLQKHHRPYSADFAASKNVLLVLDCFQPGQQLLIPLG